MNTDIGTKYPWLGAPWRSLYAYIDSGRLPPALLLTGRIGLGKTLLARTFAQRLLCRNPLDDSSCGRCDGCRLVTAGSHPDLLTIEPEEPGKPIKVESIREAIGRLSLRPHYGGHRVVLVVPAHTMNRYAANSILKTLEEPDAATVFLLVTAVPEALPITVRSRCQSIAVSAPSRPALIEWLLRQGATDQAEAVSAIARDAPFRALELLHSETVARYRDVLQTWCEIAAGRVDPVAAAASWEKIAEDALIWMSGWIEDLIRIRCAPDRAARNLLESRGTIHELAVRIDLPGLFNYLDRLGRAKRNLAGQINRLLMMEELAIHWSRLAAHSGP